MMKDLNPYWKKRLLILAALLVALLLYLCGCTSEIKKGQKAVARVNADANLQNQVAAKYLEHTPCLTPIVKDSIVTKHDTITTEKKVLIPVKLTEYKTKTLDTIIDGISVYVDSTGITVKNLNQKEVYTKTIYQTKVDQTRVNNLTDSLNAAYQQLEFKKGQLQSLSDTSNAKSKTIEKQGWIIVLLGVLLGLSVFFNVKGLITKIPIPSFLKSK